MEGLDFKYGNVFTFISGLYCHWNVPLLYCYRTVLEFSTAFHLTLKEILLPRNWINHPFVSAQIPVCSKESFKVWVHKCSSLDIHKTRVWAAFKTEILTLIDFLKDSDLTKFGENRFAWGMGKWTLQAIADLLRNKMTCEIKMFSTLISVQGYVSLFHYWRLQKDLDFNNFTSRDNKVPSRGQILSTPLCRMSSTSIYSRIGDKKDS